MKIVVNPRFSSLRNFIEKVPSDFHLGGCTVYKARNEIKVIEVNGLHLNIKQYKVPFIFNRIIYSFFRPSKASRAYRYALQILERGFETPEPVAYIQTMRGGLIDICYLVTLQSPYSRNFYEFGEGDWQARKDILKAFALHTARLHEAGIYHRDYSPGNILFDKEGGKYVFSLVDINRMDFGPVNMEKGCANFARLWGKEGMFLFLAGEYAQARGFNKETCVRLVLQYREKFWNHYLAKHAAPYNMD